MLFGKNGGQSASPEIPPVTMEAVEGDPPLPAHLRREPPALPGPGAFAPRRRPSQRDVLADLEAALPARIAAAPPPLSEEARKMVDQQRIRRAETVRDSLRAAAAARLAEFDAWEEVRLREMEEEIGEFKRWAQVRRADLAAFSDRVYAWGDEHVDDVVRAQEEQARLHARDVDIVTSTQDLLERHGVPLPPPKPAASAEGGSVDLGHEPGENAVEPSAATASAQPPAS